MFKNLLLVWNRQVSIKLHYMKRKKAKVQFSYAITYLKPIRHQRPSGQSLMTSLPDAPVFGRLTSRSVSDPWSKSLSRHPLLAASSSQTFVHAVFLESVIFLFFSPFDCYHRPLSSATPTSDVLLRSCFFCFSHCVGMVRGFIFEDIFAFIIFSCPVHSKKWDLYSICP